MNCKGFIDSESGDEQSHGAVRPKASTVGKPFSFLCRFDALLTGRSVSLSCSLCR